MPSIMDDVMIKSFVERERNDDDDDDDDQKAIVCLLLEK